MNILLGVLLANSQTYLWSGDLEVMGVKLPLVFHLDDNNPTLDSLSSKAQGVSQYKLRESGPTAYQSLFPQLGRRLEESMRVNISQYLFTQNGFQVPLVLTPGEKTLHRPQTPKPPFPYGQEEVSFSNGDAVLKGTLTLPEGYSRETPVLIMITGSGLQNRDEEPFEHKPFAVIADALPEMALHLYVTMTVDLPNQLGDVVNCTTADLMNDALARYQSIATEIQ